jgi:hypothetical protein
LESTHPDFLILDPIAGAIVRRAGGLESLRRQMPTLVQDAIDFVIDPVRTGRTRLVDLDNVEKTFVGLKVEHFFRDFIDVPKGIRDLEIDGIDVDIKNTVGTAWTIPPETYRNSEPILLFMIADGLGHCSVGLMVAKPEYLRPGANRDAKRSTSAASRQHIYWLVEKEKLPDSRWAGFDMQRFRELRNMPGGAKRAALFFQENLDRPVHRSVVQSLLHDQHDYMKRLRANGGARDYLEPNRILLLSGTYDKASINMLALPAIGLDEFIAHRCSIEEWEARHTT